MSIFVVLLPTTVGTVAAQNVVAYGQNVSGTLGPAAPVSVFTFVGAANDLVTARVIAISPELDPNISILSPTQQQVAANDNDPLVPGGTDARISTVLPADGVYLIIIAATNGTSGDFLLLLDGQPAAESDLTAFEEEMPFAGAGDGDAAAGAPNPTQVFTFSADPNAPTSASFSTADAGYMFSAEVRNATSGQLVAFVTGSDTNPVSLTLAAGNQTFSVAIFPADPNIVGTVQFTTQVVLPMDEAPPPVVTEEAAAPPPPPTTAPCIITPANNAVNIRTAPNVNTTVAGQLAVGQSDIATALTLGGDGFIWYRLTNGWVRADVVNAAGPCIELPSVDANAEAPAPVVTEEVAPQNGQQPPVQPSPTSPPSGGPPPPAQTEEAQPPQQQPPTATPPPPQQQPPTATPPPPQQQPPTATPSPQQQPPTATFTPSFTPTILPTATFTPSFTPTTPPPAQVAPQDARFNNPLNIPLDNTASVLDFVSFPGGDTEDRVRWDIIGMNPNSSLPGGRARLVISVSCFGEGTSQIQFFTGGQTFSCGQTIVDQEVTFNSKTGSVVITAVGGTGTYVQWVLTGTATRVN